VEDHVMADNVLFALLTFGLLEGLLDLVEEYHIFDQEAGTTCGLLDGLEDLSVGVVKLDRSISTGLQYTEHLAECSLHQCRIVSNRLRPSIILPMDTGPECPTAAGPQPNRRSKDGVLLSEWGLLRPPLGGGRHEDAAAVNLRPSRRMIDASDEALPA